MILAKREQTLLRRLAVFDGSFTLEAAQAVASDESIPTPGSALWGQAADHQPPGRPSASLVAALQHLVQSGQVLREEGTTGTARYRLPDPVRATGFAQLTALGEIEDTQRVHATYYLAFAEAIDRRVWTAAQPHWMARLEAAWDNVQAALAWAERAGETDIGLRLAAALWLFWQTRGRVAAGRHWLERALARDGGQPWARAAALTVAGLLAWLQDDLTAAAAMLDEALAHWRSLDFPQGIGRALFIKALVAWRQTDGAQAGGLLTEALECFRATDDLAGQPLCLIVLAIANRQAGDHERALALLDEAAGLAQFGGFAWGTAAARYYEGEIRLDRGEYAEAAMAYRASIAISWALGDPWTTGAGIGGVATIAALCDEPQIAARLFGAADTLCVAAGAFLPVLERDSYERIVTAARATPDTAAFNRAYDAGRVQALSDAVAEAQKIADRLVLGSKDVQAEPIHTPAIHLTPRELDVLRLLVEGLGDAEIAQDLHLSPRTVSERVGDMLAKLGCRNRTALAVYAVRHELA